MSNRAQLILVLGCVVSALAFVGYQVFRASMGRSYPPGTAFTEHARLAEFTENGVRVGVVMESDPQGLPLLRATFTPIDKGFHVYSKDHIPESVGGVGLATRLQLLPHPSLRVAGRPFADVTSQNHKGVQTYPDGPVSLRLPLRSVGPTTSTTAQIAVSYMACKTDGACLFPVERKVLDIQIASR